MARAGSQSMISRMLVVLKEPTGPASPTPQHGRTFPLARTIGAIQGWWQADVSMRRWSASMIALANREACANTARTAVAMSVLF